MRHFIYISAAILLCLQLNAQQTLQKQAEQNEFVETYKKVWNVLTQTENYTFKLRYHSYEDHYSKQAYETSTGSYSKSGNSYKSNIMGMKTIQNDRIKVIIDTLDHIITLSNPDKFNLGLLNTEQLQELLANSANVSKRTENKSIVFKIEFEENAIYDSYEIKVSEAGVPEKITYYYSTIRDNEYDENMNKKEISIKPRLEIHFDEFKTTTKAKDNDFSENLYVMVDGKSIKKTEKYKTYSLRDYRIKN